MNAILLFASVSLLSGPAAVCQDAVLPPGAPMAPAPLLPPREDSGVQFSDGNAVVTATSIRLRLGDESIEITPANGGKVRLTIASNVRGGERFRVLPNRVEIAGPSGAPVAVLGTSDATLEFLAPRLGAPASSQDRAYLGVVVVEAPPYLTMQLGLPSERAGLVSSVVPGSPAEAGGLQVHDVLVEIDGAPPANPKALRERLAGKTPGDTLTITYLRRGKRDTSTFILGSVPREKAAADWRESLESREKELLELEFARKSLEDLARVATPAENVKLARELRDDLQANPHRFTVERAQTNDDAKIADALKRIEARLRALEDAVKQAERGEKR